MIAKPQLLERLAQGHAAGITVVTPNIRLSQALVAEFDELQARRSKTSWEAPDVLPFGAFVERLYEEALYCEGAGELPLRLTPAQEQWLWQEALANSQLLAIAETAAQCRSAWNLVHQWRIGKGPGNDDAQAFGAWCLKYQELARGEIDAARLPDLVARLLKDLHKPRLLVAYAFDILPPQTREFFEACERHGVEVTHCQPGRRRGDAKRVALGSKKEELESAAAWARARLENRGQTPISPAANPGRLPISDDLPANPGRLPISAENRGQTPISWPRIGIVVPGLEERRAEVQRVFSRVMQPLSQLPGSKRDAMPFNISIGIPLVRYPVVALALSVLEFSQKEISFDKASGIILSSFIGGAESEMGARAKLEVQLRRKLDAAVSLPKLIGLLEKSILRERLEALFALAQETKGKAQSASAWARQFSALLAAAGFPGERGLDSDEFQARAKWHEVLGELSRLERVAQPLSFSQALHALRRLCAETLFQPRASGEGGAAPIQILGVLESAGLEFDHLWVSGLSDEAWPLAARANPFIPAALQKKAGIPEASAESSLALDRRITEGWALAADEVVFSFFARDEDRELAPSPLILGFPQGALELPKYPRLRDAIFKRRKLEALVDKNAPPLAARAMRGGTRVLSDQAACPFRAFAAWRLGAKELERPAEGLDDAERGSLVHALMKHLWSSLKDSAALERDVAPAIEAAAAAAVKEVGVEGRLAELERARLARLAAEWLAIEKTRPPFRVVAMEERRKIAVAGIEYEGRIDRMDRTEHGHVLIDYKTSRNPTPKHWQPPRPHDPQLPLYAISANEDVSAVVFAKVRAGEMRFMGFSRDEKALPGVRRYFQWEQLSKDWKEEAESLGKAFASGDARVDPKNELATCRYCALHTLCRVYEKTNPLKEPESEDGE